MISLQYITNAEGRKTSVVVPIELWHKLFPETLTESDRVLANPIMRERLLAAMQRNDGISFEAVRENLGI